MAALAPTSLIVAREWRALARDGRLRWLAAALLALLAAALVSGWIAAQRWQADADAATVQDRAAWLAQDARNPHSVAHFGQYAFKPAGALAFFDPGITATVGSGLWMEAHYQNTATLRPAEQGGGRLGGLPAAWLLQLGLPLLIVLAGYSAWAGEREAGTLRLQLVQGGRWWPLLAGKLAALALVAALLWLPLAAVLAIGAAQVSRALIVAAAYAAYALVWVALTLAVSAWVAQARTALALLLALWLATAMIVPRVASDVAERAHPSPAAQVFWADIRKAQSEGVDGHDAQDQRAKKLLQDTLDRYGVKTEAELPISFAGIALQASEEHGDKVFDRFFGQLWSSYAAQDGTRLAFSLLSPLPALQSLSQAAAGTDVSHHRHFAQAAEAHRRKLQQFLNEDFTKHAKGRDFDYRADASLWAQAPAWRYAPPRLAEAGSPLTLPAAVLGLWLVAALALSVAGARRLVHAGGAW